MWAAEVLVVLDDVGWLIRFWLAAEVLVDCRGCSLTIEIGCRLQNLFIGWRGCWLVADIVDWL